MCIIKGSRVFERGHEYNSGSYSFIADGVMMELCSVRLIPHSQGPRITGCSPTSGEEEEENVGVLETSVESNIIHVHGHE